MLMQKLLASAGGVETLYVDDLFQAHTRTGTGASATVTTGINLSVKGGMIWSKGRSGATDHAIYDTSRGATFDLASNMTSAQTTQAQGLTAFGTTGHTWGTLAKVNTNAATYVDYVFAKAPKFFDVVTWTGNATNRTISHSLGQEVGLIFVKRTDTTSDWQVYHRSLVNTEYMVLNSTAAKATGATRWNSTTPTTSVFSVGTDASVNASGGTYVAYLFAHDTGTDGIVQCGSFTTDGSGNATVSLGWEPQFSMWKTSSGAGSWYMSDTSRGSTTDGAFNYLIANTTGAEAAGTGYKINATGFTVAGFGASITHIYLAIRRPNKPPTVGTQVYNAIARTGTGAAATVTGVGFAPDLVITTDRNKVNYAQTLLWDRLRGALLQLASGGTTAELSVASSVTSFNMDGVSVDSSRPNAAVTYINHFFKRAPGVFDEVCYTTPTQTVPIVVPHGLGVTPEFAIVKRRNGTGNFKVLAAGIGLALNSSTVGWGANFTAAAASFTITVNDNDLNAASGTYVAYLFATKAGISKVFSYTGNGGSQTINCGFTTGARFVLIKRTDIAGDWYVWDTVRGIIAGNDPHLSLNTTAAEVTTNDSVDPDASGFIVNQVAATNINVNAASYIGLAFA